MKTNLPPPALLKILLEALERRMQRGSQGHNKTATFSKLRAAVGCRLYAASRHSRIS